MVGRRSILKEAYKPERRIKIFHFCLQLLFCRGFSRDNTSVFTLQTKSFSFERGEAFTDGMTCHETPSILVARVMEILVPKGWEEKATEMYVSELEAANSLRFEE